MLKCNHIKGNDLTLEEMKVEKFMVVVEYETIAPLVIIVDTFDEAMKYKKWVEDCYRISVYKFSGNGPAREMFTEVNRGKK